MYLLPAVDGHTNLPVWSENVLPVISWQAAKTLFVRRLGDSVIISWSGFAAGVAVTAA